MKEKIGMDSKHILWLLVEFDVHRYLMSNAHGRNDGAEKADRHIKLCTKFLAAYFNCEIDRVASKHYTRFDLLHSETQKLTANMPDEIGFPLKSRPDYDKLAPLFFDKFYNIAIKALDSSMKYEEYSIDKLLGKNILKGAFESAEKREKFCEDMKPCPECGTKQIQIIGWADKAKWKCRHCNHKWTT